MTILNFLGCFLTAFGPTLAVFFIYIGKTPRLVLLAMASAFYWTLLILIISVIQLYAQALPFTLAIYSVLMQELGRVGLFFAISLLRPTLSKIAPASKMNDIHHDFACGYGLGFMSALIQYIQPLVQSTGPGVLVCQSCPSIDVFYIGALITVLMTGLNTLWGVSTFHGLNERTYVGLGWVVISHLVATCSTLLVGSNVSGGCWISILVLFALLIIEARICFSYVVKAKVD